MPPWPWYILLIELLAVVLVMLLYLPFAWSNQRFLEHQDSPQI
jgi:uncharacterized membrane protein YwaF